MRSIASKPLLFHAGLLFVLGLGLAPAAPYASGQDDPPAKEAKDPVNKDILRPTAREILQKAAEVQGGKELAGALKNFKAEFETKYFQREKGKVFYQVKRVFKFPCYLWTEKKHDTQEKPSFEVYNGEDGWFVDPEGKVIVYTENPSTYETDIENLEEDTLITKQLFRYFFITNYVDEIRELKRLPDRPVPRTEGGEPVFVVEGKTTGWIGGEKTVLLKIFIHPKSARVEAVEMIDLSPGGSRRTFVFETYMKNRQGVLVPANIKMFRDKEKDEEMTIYLNCELGEDKKIYPVIQFNAKIDPGLFELPGKKE